MGQHTEKAKAKLHSLNAALESGALAKVQRILNSGLAPVDVAHLIESSPPKARKILWELVDKELEGEVLQYLSEELQSHFLSDMSAAEVVDMTADLDTDDVADMLQQLPERVTQEVLDSMDQVDRARVEAILGYPEDSAGGLMNTDTVTIRPEITLDVVLRYLRRHKSLPAMTDNLLVVNRQNEFIGLLPVSKLLVSDPQQTVREVMTTDAKIIPATMHDTDVAKLFERHDLVSAPVVDAAGVLIGRITIDDVVDVIRETADHSLMSMAGLDEDEDTFAPALKTSRRRAVWLGINLITALAASAVIGLFDKTIEQVVALAVLMPIVASMGGIAGSQVLTLVIRGQALGHLSGANFRWLFNRELIVAAINGVLWAVVIAVVTFAWFHDIKIALIIGSSIIINLLVAAITGAALPLILKARGIDPALAGGVILTTVTDVVGFMTFLGLATLFYL
ncbi:MULTISPECIES: magnesium transporter [Thalassolituus]|jgi:magnesium transporter|uniref:Magnesium transporter n=1 Tax=hydrothermal vent metagenome TaxID=652676 RepID=A0A160TD43_9ZZZZ|nr:magnesium transporter [Thalassolituus oleivorans]AHK14882.1 magnesium transporter [Thalassolituus oleivorans R6-15]APR65922.1 magnesium transporter [Thalassolituus oleivorans]MBQ0728651.1 magnesium transporter [Thalassolituus oleivorans]MBQ0779468.1 magnesium transporter [Thalassolituus oleivorans]MCA6128078.1 magnesium transporter [Thalassolituus oleivorans 4BN06-13]